MAAGGGHLWFLGELQDIFIKYNIFLWFLRKNAKMIM